MIIPSNSTIISFLLVRKINLQHNNTHTTTLCDIDLILGIDARRQVRGTVVEEVVVQLTVSRAEFLVDEEEGVIEEGEGIEDVEFGLFFFLINDQFCIDRKEEGGEIKRVSVREKGQKGRYLPVLRESKHP